MRDYGETSYIDQSIGGLTAVESRWPGQGVLTDFNVLLYCGRNRRFYFTVPADAESVSVQVQPSERCSAQLTRQDGTVVARAPYDRPQTSVLTVPREKTAASEVWSVVFPRVEEDARFRIGAPALPVVATGSSEMALTTRRAKAVVASARAAAAMSSAKDDVRFVDVVGFNFMDDPSFYVAEQGEDGSYSTRLTEGHVFNCLPYPSNEAKSK